jgi:hypothetical protein
MNLAEIVQSSGWKNFISKLYGLGASVVIVGALFKIQHWPAAGTMLTIGLLTEAVIFFFSAFEPLHEEIDWSLVYPELAGIPEDEAQGVSLDMAQIDAGSNIFECGQTYVALSRIKSLAGLYLTAFNPQKIKVNKKVQAFYLTLT